MEKERIPQDPSALDKFTREVCYVTDADGKYTTGLSRGWEVKAGALDVAWKDIEQKIAVARERVAKGEVSPLLFFMELRLMDTGILAAYTGFWQWQIKRHMKPAIFNKLSEKKLQRYAEAFNISIRELQTMEVHEG